MKTSKSIAKWWYGGILLVAILAAITYYVGIKSLTSALINIFQ